MWLKLAKANLEVSTLNTLKIGKASISLNMDKLWDIGSLKGTNLTTFWWMLLR